MTNSIFITRFFDLIICCNMPIKNHSTSCLINEPCGRRRVGSYHTLDEWLLMLVMVSWRLMDFLFSLDGWAVRLKLNLVSVGDIQFGVIGVSIPVNGSSDSSLRSLASLVKDICLFALVATLSGSPESHDIYNSPTEFTSGLEDTVGYLPMAFIVLNPVQRVLAMRPYATHMMIRGTSKSATSRWKT